MHKRVIALDVGDVWIGVAHSDLLRTIAIPQPTWTNKEFDIQFQNYLKMNKVDLAIIGLPKTLQGGESLQTKKVYDWIAEKKNLFDKHHIEIQFFDERLTSQFAKKIIRQNKKNKFSDHSIAAAIILENFLSRI